MRKFICDLGCSFLLLGLLLVTGAGIEATLPLGLCAALDLVFCAAFRGLSLLGRAELSFPKLHRPALRTLFSGHREVSPLSPSLRHRPGAA